MGVGIGLHTKQLRRHRAFIGELSETPTDKFRGYRRRGTGGLLDIPSMDDEVVESQAEDATTREISGDVMPLSIEDTWLAEGGELLVHRSSGTRCAAAVTIEQSDCCGHGLIGGLATEDLACEPVASGDMVNQYSEIPVGARCWQGQVVVVDCS